MWIPNPAFLTELAADVETVHAIRSFADTALAGAKAAAPVKTGKYRDSLFADDTGLGSTSSFWHLIEFGSVHNPPSAPLRRGVEFAGLVMTDSGHP